MMGDLSIPQMFNKISYRYEFLNHLFSFYLDEYWREKLSKFAKGFVLDVGTGTGEVIKHLANNKKVKSIIGIDLAEEMLKYAIRNKNFPNVVYIIADGQKLPFKDNSFDSITIAFCIRNIDNRVLALKEFYRVLRENGVLAILEMLGPENFLKYPFKFYLKFIIPKIAKLFLKDKSAYIYLYNSVFNFPKRRIFASMIRSVGFEDVSIIDMTLGTCTIFLAKKK